LTNRNYEGNGSSYKIHWRKLLPALLKNHKAKVVPILKTGESLPSVDTTRLIKNRKALNNETMF